MDFLIELFSEGFGAVMNSGRGRVGLAVVLTLVAIGIGIAIWAYA